MPPIDKLPTRAAAVDRTIDALGDVGEAPNSTIRWLHLTDLHVGMDDQDYLWPRVGDKFRTDLERIYESAGPWDLVLFTGDFVQKGREYARLDDIFGEMWGWFAELGCDPRLLAVPGNHDLQWRDAKSAVVKTLYAWEKDSDVREEFWSKPDSDYRKTVNEAFSVYQRWWQNHPKRPDNVQWGLLPGDFSCTIQEGHARLGVVGLNSAFLQLTEKRGKGSHRGHLVIDPRQFHAACGGDGVKWTRSHHACFLMTHHPPQWLNRESKAYLDGEILESFCLHLCGHNHEADVLRELRAGAEQAPLRWLGRSLFGLEKMANGKLDRSHGYTAGELHVVNDGSGYLQFAPRGRVIQGATWSLVPDHAAAQLPDGLHTRPFTVQVGQGVLPPVANPTQMGGDPINGTPGRSSRGTHASQEPEKTAVQVEPDNTDLKRGKDIHGVDKKGEIMPPAPLTLQKMASHGFMNALIVAYPDETSATSLLLAVGFPQHQMLPFNDAQSFWLRVCKTIAAGASPGAFEPLLAAAAEDYPKSPKFAPYRGGNG